MYIYHHSNAINIISYKFDKMYMKKVLNDKLLMIQSLMYWEQHEDSGVPLQHFLL